MLNLKELIKTVSSSEKWNGKVGRIWLVHKVERWKLYTKTVAFNEQATRRKELRLEEIFMDRGQWRNFAKSRNDWKIIGCSSSISYIYNSNTTLLFSQVTIWCICSWWNTKFCWRSKSRYSRHNIFLVYNHLI